MSTLTNNPFLIQEPEIDPMMMDQLEFLPEPSPIQGQLPQTPSGQQPQSPRPAGQQRRTNATIADNAPHVTLAVEENNNMTLLKAPTNVEVAKGNIIDLRNQPLIIQWNPKTVKRKIIDLARGDLREGDEENIHKKFMGALLTFQWVSQSDSQSDLNSNPVNSKGYYNFQFQFPYYDETNPNLPAERVQIYSKPTSVCKAAKLNFNKQANQRYLPKCNGYDEMKYQTVAGKWKPLKYLIPNTVENQSLSPFFPIGPSKMKHLPLGWDEGWLINVEKLKRARFIERTR